MAVTTGQESDITPKQVPTISTIETAFSEHNDGASEHGTLQAIVSHQSLDTAATSNDTAPFADIMQSDSQSTPTIGATHQQVHVSPTISASLSPGPPNTNTNTVPEFLYQLTKMLTDNNRDIIEWSNGKIEVHNPHKLQTQVLNRYFRHSKFASFQRQLNYFGFRKLAGKGKMAPCSYVNDATTKELGSLLTIKRKVGNEPKLKNTKKRDRDDVTSQEGNDTSHNPSVNPILANILYRSSTNESCLVPQSSTTVRNTVYNPPNRSQQEIARVAVGRGIRHSFSHPLAKKPTPVISQTVPSTQTDNGDDAERSNDKVEVVHASLSALKDNFQSSLEAAQEEKTSLNGDSGDDSFHTASYIPGSMRRDDSLVDLAMIPYVDEENQTDNLPTSGLTFIDFPWQDPNLFSDG